MFRFKKWLPPAMGLAVAVALSAAAPVRADIELEILVGTSVVYNSGDVNATSFANSGSADGITWQFSGGVTSSPNGGYPNIALDQSTFQLSNTSRSTQTVTVEFSANNFTTPTTPPPLYISSASSVAGGTGSLSVNFNSYIGNNTLLDTSGPSSGAVVYSESGQYGAGGGPAVGTVVQMLPQNPFSVTSVGTYTLGNGATVNNIGGNTELTSLPEPASIVTAFAAMPFLGLGAWLRRRKQAA